MAACRKHRGRYRLHWGRDHAGKPERGTGAATRIGASNDGARLVVVDRAGGRLSKLADDAKPQVDAATSHGTLRNPVAYRNAATGGWRMSFELVRWCARERAARAAGRCAGRAVGNLVVPVRPEGRRVGKECASTVRSRWSPAH